MSSRSHIKCLFKSLIILLFTQRAGSAEIGFNGQLSSYIISNQEKRFVTIGGRYLPKLDGSLTFSGAKLDAEVSADIKGSAQLSPDHDRSSRKEIALYRAWVRLTTDRSEARLGRQQINFGTGNLLRPLQWFDRIDPRDPLSLSPGQWGLVSKIYFSGNDNLWLWGLYGNRDLRRWEYERTCSRCPEYGGRLEWSLPRGEMALAAHRRWVEATPAQRRPEHRLGLEGKWDLGPGIWGEACWIGRRPEADRLFQRKIFMGGADYTFGLGTGLYLSGEHLVLSDGASFAEFTDNRQLSALSAVYHPSLGDQLKLISFFDWRAGQPYFFFDWGREIGRLTLHLMAFWSSRGQDRAAVSYQDFGSRGLGLMAVFNH